jgi:hypothetical protein
VFTRIQALNFRSLHYVDQSVRGFQVIVGPNGAGKSSFLDVIALLGDILVAGPLNALIGDTARGVPPRASNPRDIAWLQSRTFELAVELRIPDELRNGGRFAHARYEVGIDVGGGAESLSLTHETLYLVPERPPRERKPPELFPRMVSAPPTLHERQHTGWRTVVNKTQSGNDYFKGESSNWNNQFRLGPNRSALANLPEDETRFPIAIWVRRVFLEGVQRVVLAAEDMRRASPPGSPTHFLPDGSNLPWVVRRLRERAPHRYEQWLAHVRTALPEIRGIEVLERPEDLHSYLVVEYENGLRAASWVVSDGTLRLLALTLIAFLGVKDSIYLIEEPENGIHPLATETVIQALSHVYDCQVLCASHSPVVLSAVEPSDLLVFARDSTGATDIVPGDLHPHLHQWKSGTDLGTLFAAGVLGSRGLSASESSGGE